MGWAVDNRRYSDVNVGIVRGRVNGHLQLEPGWIECRRIQTGGLSVLERRNRRTDITSTAKVVWFQRVVLSRSDSQESLPENGATVT
jgi:hypothetical protein